MVTILASYTPIRPELADTCEIVRCNHCMAVFEEEEIIDQDGEEVCPHCGKGDGLMDMEGI